MNNFQVSNLQELRDALDEYCRRGYGECPLLSVELHATVGNSRRIGLDLMNQTQVCISERKRGEVNVINYSTDSGW